MNTFVKYFFWKINVPTQIAFIFLYICEAHLGQNYFMPLSFQDNFPAFIFQREKFSALLILWWLQKFHIPMRLRKNFGAILHPRVRNILSHELATNTIWHFRHLIFHIWKENGGIYQKKRNVLFTGLEKCLIFTFCRIKQR